MIDPTDAPPGYVALPAPNGCEGCAFRRSNGCSMITDKSIKCGISRKDGASVIFKKKEEVHAFDPTDAPEGYVASPSVGSVCSGCAFWPMRQANDGSSEDCPRDQARNLRCTAARKDRTSAIFTKKAETDKQETPKPLDLSSFDDATMIRTLDLVLREIKRRRGTSAAKAVLEAAKNSVGLDEPPF